MNHKLKYDTYTGEKNTRIYMFFNCEKTRNKLIFKIQD